MTRKIASRSVAVALALGTLTNFALAEPLDLTDTQMDQIRAGAFTYDSSRNLYDVNGNVFTYDPAGDLYTDANGQTWTPNGIQYYDDGFAHGILSHASVSYDGETWVSDPRRGLNDEVLEVVVPLH